MALPIPEEFEEPADCPCHPACMEHEGSDYCRESLQLHLAELREQPEPHWHKCDFCRLCAYVPVVHNARCLAAVKLACPASMADEEFDRQVELLDLLVRDFVASAAVALKELPQAERAAAKLDAAPPAVGVADGGAHSTHPKVVRALHYIEEHIKEPNLTVGRIAEELDLTPSYLSQLFVEQVGQRMSRRIAARRVELAKNLLATTDWQIKRIAHEAGYANHNWFFHVFRALTGRTPAEYREGSRGQEHPAQLKRTE